MATKTSQRKKSSSQKNRKSSSKPMNAYNSKAKSKRKNYKDSSADTKINTKKNNLVNAKNPRNQIVSVLLFGFSILFFCVALLKGENIWNMVHNLVWGIFGKSSFLLPVLFIYISINTALDKPQSSMSINIWLSVIIITLFASTFYIFTSESVLTSFNFLERLKQLYSIGLDGKGAGVLSGIFGIPMVYAFGSIGAEITVLVLMFVSIMFFTGTNLIQLFRAIITPAAIVVNSNKSKEYDVGEKDEDYYPDEYLQHIDRTADIDIPVGKMPKHPVKIDIPVEKRKGKNSKLDNLKRAFNIPMEETISGTLEREKKLNLKEMSNEVKAEEENSAAKVAAAFLEKKKNESQLNDNNSKSIDSNATSLSLNEVLKEMDVDQKYVFPPISLLEQSKKTNDGDIKKELELNGQMLVDTLKSFNVQTKIVDISRGPTVTRYELQPAAGVKISKITNLADDIALNLAAAGVRIEAPIPGKAAVGIEIPNKVNSVVRMNELINSNIFVSSNSRLSVVLGKDIAGKVTIADLSKMPHLLIAGSTGSGKSVCINSFIISLLYKSTPAEVKLLMIDPKVVELGIYNGIPHLLVPVVTDPRKAAGALNWAVNEMLKRYKVFADNNVRDLQSYNKMVMRKLNSVDGNNDGEEKLELMPQIVIIIDELADLMMAAPNEVEDAICRLAQMARAAGMHLVIATQRPSVDVITGIIKANIPSRIALAVSSQIDSRTILDMSGAEKLLGRGDMLFAPVGSQKPIRIQGCYVTDKEIENIVSFIKNSDQQNTYDQEVIEEIEKNAVKESDKEKSSADIKSTDPMMEEAIKCIVEAGQASTSFLQRRLRLGYARAGRLIDEMEQMGIVGPHEGSKPRQVLMTYQQWLERNMQKSDE